MNKHTLLEQVPKFLALLLASARLFGPTEGIMERIHLRPSADSLLKNYVLYSFDLVTKLKPIYLSIATCYMYMNISVLRPSTNLLFDMIFFLLLLMLILSYRLTRNVSTFRPFNFDN